IPPSRRYRPPEFLTLQSECNESVTGWCFQFSPAADGNRDVLTAVHRISAWRRVTARGELMLPEHAAGLFVERAELLVPRAADEHQTSRRIDAAAEIFGSGLRNTPRFQCRIFAQRLLPSELAPIQIDRIQRSPGRFDRRITELIEKSNVAFVPIRIAFAGGLFRQRQQVGKIIGVYIKNAAQRIE